MLHNPDVARSTTAYPPDEILVVIVEISRSTWLAAGLVPGVDRRPLKKLEPDENGLMRLLESWRD
jgi:transposase